MHNNFRYIHYDMHRINEQLKRKCAPTLELALYFITTINRFRNLAVGAENYGCQRAKYMLMVGAERCRNFSNEWPFFPIIRVFSFSGLILSLN